MSEFKFLNGLKLLTTFSISRYGKNLSNDYLLVDTEEIWEPAIYLLTFYQKKTRGLILKAHGLVSQSSQGHEITLIWLCVHDN